MINTTFRQTISHQEPTVTQDKPNVTNENTYRSSTETVDNPPIEIIESEGKDVLLNALGIDDRINNIPSEDRKFHNEVKDYILNVIEKKGLSPTQKTFNSVLETIKSDMGLSSESDPTVVLSRIGGVIDAWKNVSFIKNPQEKRSIFMKLGKAQSSEEMNRIVFDSWERAKIWQ